MLTGHRREFKQHAIQNADQHFPSPAALGLWYVGFHEVRNRLQTSDRFSLANAHAGTISAGKQGQRSRRRLRELLDQLRAVGSNRQTGIAPDSLLALRWVGQRGTQADKGVHAALRVRRYAQVLEGISRVFTHAHQEHGRTVGVVIHPDRQHVILELTRLARRIAQLVAHAGADIAQLFFRRGLVGSAEPRLDGLVQINLAHIGSCRRRTARVASGAKIFHVDDTQCRELERQFFSAVALAIDQAAGAANRALDFEGFAGCGHRDSLERDAGAAVVEAGLVNLHTLVVRGMVDLNPRIRFFARRLVVDDDIAGKKLGHAGGVILNDEFL